jgi:alcohol dehydrogenase YqhD (iron-dependent ADH family)
MQFEFATAAKIIFGAGKINSIGTLIEDYGNRVLIITGAPQSISEKLLNLLNLSEANCSLIKIDNEPTVTVVREVVEFARKISTNLVIGIGGGSALDSSKATQLC